MCNDKLLAIDKNTSEPEKTKTPEDYIENSLMKFFCNTKGCDNSPKYEALALELAKTKEITLDVSIADIRKHSQTLIKLINAKEYRQAFQVLYNTL